MNDQVVGQDEIVAAIAAVYPLEQMPARGAAPADRWRYLDGRGTVGVIPTVTKPFCGDCDRVRLTADGQFRTCLFATDEFDLRAAMRAGETDDEVAARIERAVGTKWAGHQHQPGQLHPPGALDEPDRRLMRRSLTAAAAVTIVTGAGIAAAAIPSIDDPATAGIQAERVNPPGPTLGGCPMFPADNAWNQDVSHQPLHPRSAQIIAQIQADGLDNLHPDFGENPDYGIPFVVVPATQPLVPITYTAYGDESDPGPFPIPLDAPVEGGGRRRRPARARAPPGHVRPVRAVRRAPHRDPGGTPRPAPASTSRRTPCARSAGPAPTPPGCRSCPGWCATTRWPRASSATPSASRSARPRTGTSSRRRTPRRIRRTRTARRWGCGCGSVPRYDMSQLTGQARVIAVAMQQYGLIVADNGSNWFFQGAPSPSWNDDDLNQLKDIPGTAFEVVDTGTSRRRDG